MTVRFYSSNDAGAPVMSGNAAGQIIAILDACLVNGYGAKAAAGWSKPFSGANIAAYRSGLGSNQMYLRVDDTASGSNRAARVAGFETMTDINTGTGQFPTAAGVPGGLYWISSYSTETAVRGWLVVASEKFFHLFIDASPANTDYKTWFYFGDINSYKPGDAYGTVLRGQTSTTVNATSIFDSNTSYSSVTTQYMARKYDQTGGSIVTGRFTDTSKLSGLSYFGQQGLPYPHGPDGGLWLAPIWVGEGNSSLGCVRGTIPGAWAPLHAMPLNSFDTFTGTGELAGKSFVAIRSSSYGVFLETSDTW